MFREISDQTIDRYSKRFDQLGENVKSLGWGSLEQQNDRFDNLLKNIHSP